MLKDTSTKYYQNDKERKNKINCEKIMKDIKDFLRKKK